MSEQHALECPRAADRSTFSTAVAAEQLIGVASRPNEPVRGPLIHLVCTRCQAEVWWPAELTVERRCFHCGGDLHPCEMAPEASGEVPDGMAPIGHAHAVGLLHRLAEHQGRNAHAQRREPAVDSVAPPDDTQLDYQAQADQRLELLAASLDRLHVDDLDALRVVIELLPDLAPTAGPADVAQLRVIVDRARRAVESIANVMLARDARA